MSYKPDSFKDWKIGEIIGKGSFGSVYIANNENSEDVAALKIIKTKYKISSPRLVSREIRIHLTLNHQNIIKLIEWGSEAPNYFFLLLEHARKLSNVFALHESREKPLVQSYMKQLLNGLNYLHSNCVIHSDIKLSNLLVKNKVLKICDFGLSYLERQEQEVFTQCRRGSRNIMAPEVYNKLPRRGRPADMWSAGVTFFRMLVGFYPWSQPDVVLSVEYKKWFEKKSLGFVTWKDLDEDFNDLLNELLQLKPEKRLTAESALKHKYFANE